MKKCVFLMTILVSLAASLQAQISGPLPISLGQRKDPATGNVYSISSDGRDGEKSRTLLLALTKPSSLLTDFSRYDIATTLRTGKSRTVAQTLGLLRGVFQKFTAGVAAGTSLGSLGSVEKGGQVDFVAVGPETLRLIFKSPEGVERTVDYSRADAVNFLLILQPAR